jgi:hypothetical protein
MNFDISNCSLKIWDFKRTPTFKVGIHLGVCGLIPSLSHTPRNVNVIPWFHYWPTPFHAPTFPCPCFGYKPKVRVVTIFKNLYIHSIELHSI